MRSRREAVRVQEYPEREDQLVLGPRASVYLDFFGRPSLERRGKEARGSG